MTHSARPGDEYRPARLLAAGALVATGLSISLTQIAVFFAACATAFCYWRSGGDAAEPRRAGAGSSKRVLFVDHAPFLYIIVPGALLFAWLALSALAHASQAAGRPGELLDVGLFLFAPLFYFLAMRAPPGDRVFARGFEILIWILLVSGLVAVFSEFRLARLVMGYGFEASAANRPQHLLGEFLRTAIFRPVGFMNTRLTYAGLLILVLPALAGQLANGPGERLPTQGRGWLVFGMRRALPLGLAPGILALNGTRSALIGAVAGLLFCLPLFWNSLSRIRLRAAILLVVLALVGGAAYGFSRTAPFRIASAQLTRHTDFQRQIIWAGSAEILAGRPWLGAGPGGFRGASLEWRRSFLREHPHTLYWIQLTPSGHAHNDFLHLAAAGGLPAGLFFLLLAMGCVFAGHRESPGEAGGLTTGSRLLLLGSRWLLMGSAGFFVAGLFQCYFQDDEVVALFWMLMALAAADRARGGMPGGEP